MAASSACRAAGRPEPTAVTWHMTLPAGGWGGGAMPSGQWRAGVDIGGTFTDLLLVDGESGRFQVGKVLTTVSEPAAGVRAALGRGLQAGALPPEAMGAVELGATLVMHALR